jgi:cytidylate kinase
MQAVMEELADAGATVIVGRAGQVILQRRPDVLHVKVFAPVEVRVERIAAQQNISLESAHAQVEASDRARSSFLRRFYHARWDDPALYDIVINTARLSPEQAACMVGHAVNICQSTKN